MKNKKGFIFIETIIVIAILSIALIPMYNALYNITNHEHQNLKHDSSIHLYRTYYILEFLKEKGAFDLANSSINSTFELSCTHILLQPNYFQFCNSLMTNLEVEKIYFLKPGFKENINSFDSKEQRYLRTTDDSESRIFIIFKDDYYASLKVTS